MIHLFFIFLIALVASSPVIGVMIYAAIGDRPHKPAYKPAAYKPAPGANSIIPGGYVFTPWYAPPKTPQRNTPKIVTKLVAAPVAALVAVPITASETDEDDDPWKHPEIIDVKHKTRFTTIDESHIAEVLSGLTPENEAFLRQYPDMYKLALQGFNADRLSSIVVRDFVHPTNIPHYDISDEEKLAQGEGIAMCNYYNAAG